MPFLLSDEQQQISREARKLLTDLYSGARLRACLESKGAYDEVFWSACQEMGWTGVTVPEAYGGLALSPVELCLIAQECGRALGGAPFLAGSFAVGDAVRLWGDETGKNAYLPGIASGELKGALALGEQAGEAISDAPETRLKDGLLYGIKSSVVGGAAADIAVVLAADPAQEPVLAVVDLHAATVARKALPTLDNSRCTADLTFSAVPAARLECRNALDAAHGLLQRAALVTAFEQLGGAEACMEMARDYAIQRQAFGQPIGKFQAIKHKIAEMYVLNELARGAAMRAALSLAADLPDFALRAAAARIAASEAYEYAAGEAIQVHGAIGVTWEHDLHLHYRRARANALELGAMAMWEDLIVDALAENA